MKPFRKACHFSFEFVLFFSEGLSEFCIRKITQKETGTKYLDELSELKSLLKYSSYKLMMYQDGR